MRTKITQSNVVVAEDLYWIPVAETPPPLGVKALAINKDQKVTFLTILTNKSLEGITHWFPLPRFHET